MRKIQWNRILAHMILHGLLYTKDRAMHSLRKLSFLFTLLGFLLLFVLLTGFTLELQVLWITYCIGFLSKYVFSSLLVLNKLFFANILFAALALEHLRTYRAVNIDMIFPLVIIPVSVCRKAFLAEITFEWLISRMNSHMYC